MKEGNYLALVGNKLKMLIEQTGLTSEQIAKKCQAEGYSISESDISKFKKGQSLKLFKVYGLCKVLGFDLERTLACDENADINTQLTNSDVNAENVSLLIEKSQKLAIEILEKQNIPVLCDPQNDELKQWKGSYYCYFFPTIESKTDLLEGIMEIGCKIGGGLGNNQCMVSFELNTQEAGNFNKKESRTNIKRYFGTFMLSNRLNTAHITLIESKVGEISYLSMVNPGTLYEGVRCQIAFALTVSSGGTRAPTAHRMLLSREQLDADKQEALKGFLYMNASEILITEEEYKKAIADPRCPESFKTTFFPNGKFWFPYGEKKDVVYSIKDDWIEGAKMTEIDKLTTLNLLKEYSVSRRYHKLGPRVGENYFKMIKALMDKKG